MSLVPEGALGAGLRRVDGGRPVDHVVVDAVLRVRRDRWRCRTAARCSSRSRRTAPPAPRRRGRSGEQLERAEERVLDPGRRVARRRHRRPGPPTSQDQVLRNQAVGSTCRVSASGPGVGHRDRHQQVIGAGLGVVHLDDPVPVSRRRPRCRPARIRAGTGCASGSVDQVLVGERALRIVVAPPVPGVAGHRVEVPPVLLDVLAVVALRPGQPEGPLLQDRVAAVPQGQAQAQPLLDVAEPGQPVLAPPVGPGPGVVVRQVVPRLPVRAVVLADRAPLPLADVRSPPVPVARLAKPVLHPAEPGRAVTFGAHRCTSFASCSRPRCRYRQRRRQWQSPDEGDRMGVYIPSTHRSEFFFIKN